MSVTVTWSPGMSLEVVEKQVIKAAMKFHGGNKTATARTLGIAIRTLDNKLEKYAEEKDWEDMTRDDRQHAREQELRRHRFGRQASGPQTQEARKTSAEKVLIVERDGPTHDPETGVILAPAVNSESASESPPEQAMPMPKRQEIQSVLPREATLHRQERRRGRMG